MNGEIRIPDIGNATDVDVIDVMVKVGDTIAKDDSLITLETAKASMDVPSPCDGTIAEVKVAVGDKVSEGDLIVMLKEGADTQKTPEATTTDQPQQKPQKTVTKQVVDIPDLGGTRPAVPPAGADVYAGPAVRRIAYEFGIDLNKITGSGHKGRLLKEDLQAYVKQRLASPDTGIPGLSIAPAPNIDFAQFGKIETKALNKIKRLTGSSVHRSWLTAPQVTQFDEVDITELEKFRKTQKANAEKQGYKVTILAFAVKAVVKALQEFPQFNASLDSKGANLVIKHYYNIGIAVDTPNGLVVPVLQDADQKGVFELAEEMTVISKKARDKGLTLKEMEGGCFSISSLGGISGTAFTPIVNTPEVAILGLSRSKLQPVYQRDQFVPRLMLPLSLSYDHRVIDGAEAARFTAYLAACLTDIRRLLL